MKKILISFFCSILLGTCACAQSNNITSEESQNIIEASSQIVSESTVPEHESDQQVDGSSIEYSVSQGTVSSSISENPSNDIAVPPIIPESQLEDYADLLDSITNELNQKLANDDNFGGAFYNSHLKKIISIWTLDKDKLEISLNPLVKEAISQDVQIEFIDAKYSIRQLNEIMSNIKDFGNAGNRLEAMIAYSKNRISVYVNKLSPELDTYISDNAYRDFILLDRGDVYNPAT